MSIRAILSRKATKEVKKDLKVQEKQNIEISDRLAMERTKLANERTFLAYNRTAMALVLAGLTFIKLFEDALYKGIGILAIPAGLGVAYFGYRRFTKKQEAITMHTTAYTPTSPTYAEVATQEKKDPATEL
jgi:putative membrane protein